MFHYSLDNSSRLGIYRNFQNVEVAGMSHFDPRNNWWIFVELPTVEGLAPLQRMIHKFILVFAFAALFTISTVFIFSRVTLRPLDNFLASMGRLASGERNVRFDVPEKSELAFLAQGFNNMAKALDERIADLVDSESKLRSSQEQYKSLNSLLRVRIDEATHELIDANRKLEDSAMEADAANKAKSNFLATMSHELRTPLNAILGYSEYLAGEMGSKTDPEWIELLGRINTSGKHLLQLIGNILDLSKIEAGKIQLNLEYVAIPELVDVISDTIIPLTNKKNNRFVVTCANDIGALETDSLRLRQVLINLLGNACKFTEDGTIELAVSTLSHKGTKWVRFDIRDSGIGLTREQINRLFEAFNQAETSTTRKYGGTGLGLAISQQLCRLMGGDISVQSEPNRGSTFTVTLPFKQTTFSKELNSYTQPSEPKSSAALAELSP
jgi:two-component system sensor kinase